VTERQWQAIVLELATLYGWTHFHVYDSRRSDPGWPDLTLVRTPELVFAELKTDRGRLTPAQVRWLQLLTDCGQETHGWRPRDLDVVHERLKRRY
jgi:hypothetical protein